MSKLFWDALGRFLYQDLVRSSAAAANPFMTVFEDSCSPGNEDLDEGGSFTIPCERILQWSWGNFLRDPCMNQHRSL